MKGASTIFLVLGLIYFRLQPAAADEFDAIADIVAKPAVLNSGRALQLANDIPNQVKHLTCLRKPIFATYFILVSQEQKV